MSLGTQILYSEQSAFLSISPEGDLISIFQGICYTNIYEKVVQSKERSVLHLQDYFWLTRYFQSCSIPQGRKLTIYSPIPIPYGLRADPGALTLQHFQPPVHSQREICGRRGLRVVSAYSRYWITCMGHGIESECLGTLVWHWEHLSHSPVLVPPPLYFTHIYLFSLSIHSWLVRFTRNTHRP